MKTEILVKNDYVCIEIVLKVNKFSTFNSHNKWTITVFIYEFNSFRDIKRIFLSVLGILNWICGYPN